MDTSTTSSNVLQRDALGVIAIVFFVMAAAAPLTAIVGAAPLAFSLGNGAGAPAAYVIAGIIYLIFSAGFVAMSRYVGSAGAFYVLVVHGLGPSWGIAAGAMTLLTYEAIQLAIFAWFGVIVSGLLTDVGLTVPWWLCTAFGIGVVNICAGRNIQFTGRILSFFMLGEILVLTILDLAILFSGGGPEGINFESFQVSNVFAPGLGISLLFAVASFLGFEATVIFAEEARDAKRTIPRATYIAVVLISIFYGLSAWCMVLAHGASSIKDVATTQAANLFPNTATSVVGPWLTWMMNAFLLTSLLACVLSFQSTICRYLFAWGREGLLPSMLASLHAKHKSPIVANHVQSGIALLIIFASVVLQLDPYTILYSWLAAASAIGILAVQILVAFSVIGYFYRNTRDATLWQRLGSPILSALALAGCLALAMQNLPLLAGSESNVVWLLPCAFVVAGLAGLGRARYLARNEPQKYAALGSNQLL